MSSFVSKNPYNGETFSTYPTVPKNEIGEHISLSAKAFEGWKKLEMAQRGDYFTALAQVMEKSKEELAQTITFEMGKPIKESIAELDKSIACCRYYAGHAQDLLSPQFLEGADLKAEVIFQPLGVIFGVFPWNFPFWQVIRFAVPTIMAGNTAIFKHASNVPHCALLIEETFIEAGFPKGVLQNIFADVKEMETIISNPRIKAVTLTGSEKAGASVAALAGKYLKKSVMELGGSDAFVILEDADMEITVKAALRSRFQNSGQSCTAAKRFIVRKEVAETFTQALLKGLQKLKQGNPMEPGITLGTLARADLADTIEVQLKQSLAAGATLLAGGKKIAEAVFEPTIITNVPLTCPAFREETFGPLAPIFIVETDEEALQLANDTIYGLGSSVWTSDIQRARHFAEGIHSGMVYINEMVRSTPELPFGGINNSGYGRELSVFGIREFVNVKAIYTGK